MKAIKFKGMNVTFAENQPEYIPLPAHKDKEGIVTTCWKMSWLERFVHLFTGKIFIQTMTFNQPIQPLKVEVIL